MLVRKFASILLLVFCICVIINTIIFIRYPSWFIILYKKDNYSSMDSLVDSITYVSGILSTCGDNGINPVSNEAKIWVTILQTIPYILIPIFIAMSS